MAPLRIVFMGTPDLAAASLEALVRCPDFQIVGVVTQPDQPKGRGLKLQPSPVKQLAAREQLPVLQPQRARDETFLKELAQWTPDLIAVAAYGQILPAAILDLPPHGCLNVHTSLLPKFRGAAPIQWALLRGEPETGVTIMKMDPGLDTGAILAQEKTPIDDSDNSQTVHDRLARLGADLLVQTIPRYVIGAISPRPQPADGVSYAPKIKKEDGRIHWNAPAIEIWNRIRALVPWPGAFTHFRGDSGEVLLKIWEATVERVAGEPGIILRADDTGVLVGCGTDALRITALQREGGRRMAAREFLAGHKLQPGQKLD